MENLLGRLARKTCLGDLVGHNYPAYIYIYIYLFIYINIYIYIYIYINTEETCLYGLLGSYSRETCFYLVTR